MQKNLIQAVQKINPGCGPAKGRRPCRQPFQLWWGLVRRMVLIQIHYEKMCRIFFFVHTITRVNLCSIAFHYAVKERGPIVNFKITFFWMEKAPDSSFNQHLE